jgi:hypothetical protein
VVNNWNESTDRLVKNSLKLGSYGWWQKGPDDSTGYDFIPNNYVETEYSWNPIDFHVGSYAFTNGAMKEIETTINTNDYPNFDSWNDFGIECEMTISIDGYIKEPIIKTKISKRTKKEIYAFLNNLPQLEPGRNKNNKIIIRRGLMFIQGGKIVSMYKTDEQYINSFDNKYAKYEDTPIKSIEDAELNYYIFRVSKLGWINCDRFYEANETINMMADIPVNNNTKIKMVFRNIDGVLPATIVEGKYLFANIPKGDNITIIGINNNGETLLTAFHDVKTSEMPLSALTFQETTMQALKTKLEGI